MITATSSYADIKNCFTDESGKVKSDLPTTLDSDCAYYHNVPSTAGMYINTVDKEIIRLGSKIGESADAKASKLNLYRLYKALQIKENWEAPIPTLSDFNNKYNQE